MIREIARHRRWAAALASVVLRLVAMPLLVLNRLRRRSAAPARILVLEPWGIGDLVLATGALRSLRLAYPDARISVLAKSWANSLVVAPEMASDVVAYDFPFTAFTGKYRLSRYRIGELTQLISGLRATRFDLVLNARADIRNNVLGALIGGSRFVSVDCGAGNFLATDVVNVTAASHRSEDWAAVAQRALGPLFVPSAPRLTVSATARDMVAEAVGLSARDERPVIGIHPGAAAAVRRWGLGRFAAVADILEAQSGARIVVFADPDGYGAEIPLRTKPIVIRRELGEAAVALSLCDVVICSDSGLMHVTSALGVPVVALFGPGQLEWFGPRGGESRIVQIEPMPCRPCFDSCRFAEAHCMTQLGESDVVERTLELLRIARPSPVANSLPPRTNRSTGMAVSGW